MQSHHKMHDGEHAAAIGIAIGAGTDVAIESAGVVLASNDPRAVLSVIELSKAGYRKMLQNLFWAAGYNVVTVPLAAGVLAPIGILLSPAVGAVLMSPAHNSGGPERPAPQAPGPPALSDLSA
jgi:cation transport ATPase